MAAAHAVATVRSINRAASVATPSAPSAGISRVLARPATGALARIAIATGSAIARDIAIAAGERCRLRAEEIRKPQLPHQEDGADRAALLPAPPRRGDSRGEAERPAHALEPLRELDI